MTSDEIKRLASEEYFCTDCLEVVSTPHRCPHARERGRREREQFAVLQREALVKLGLSVDEVEEAMQPLLSFNAMCDENDAEDAGR